MSVILIRNNFSSSFLKASLTGLQVPGKRRISVQQLRCHKLFQLTARPFGKCRHSSTLLLRCDNVNTSHLLRVKHKSSKRTFKPGPAGGTKARGPLSSSEEAALAANSPRRHIEQRSLSTRPYKWSKLTSETSIRVLQLKSAPSTNDDLYCEIFEITLEEPVQPFEAISYACGDYSPTVLLYINHGSHVLITENLAAALRTFRYHDRDRVLWVDTVCINQSDTNEKSQQVGLMHKIYKAADVVQAWLGEADDQTSLAFSTLQDLANERIYLGERWVLDFQSALSFRHRTGTEQEKENELRVRDNEEAGFALCSMLNRDYFTRRWIIQEFALARNIVINFGNHRLTWDVLSYAFMVIKSLRQEAFVSKWMLQVRAHNAWAVVQIRLGKLHHQSGRDLQGAGVEYHRYLMHLLKANETARCREDHDRIYALLGLAEDDFLKDGSFLKPDYNQNIEATLHSIAYAYLLVAGNPRILNHVRSTKTLPLSFAPDWRVDTTTEQLGGYGSVSYKAGITSSDETAYIESAAGLPVLPGWYVDEIYCANHKTFKGPQMNPLTHACYLIAKWHSEYEKFRASCRNVDGKDAYGLIGESFGDVFARLMVADNRVTATRNQLGSDVTNAELRSICDKLILRTKRHGLYAAAAASESLTFNVMNPLVEMAEAAKTAEGREEQQILHYLHAAAHIVNNRSLIISLDDWIGVGPVDCRPNDVIAVLAGTETPFVLRPVFDTNGTSERLVIPEEWVAETAAEHESHAKGRTAGRWIAGLPKEFLLALPHEKSNVYTVVGECYVHGIMDGEFMVFTERRRKFTLR